MRFTRTLNVVDAHAEGESGKVVVGGVGPVPGETMFDKRMYFSEHLDQLRKLLLCEPRGAVWHNANVLLSSNHPDADFGYIILESAEYPAMSGSNTMCVATVLLETGMLPMTEPVTSLNLEFPAGLIRIEAACRDGKVERVKLVNQPAFVYHQDAKVDVPGLGNITLDVAYGGMTYAIVDADSVGLRLDVSQEAAMYDLGQRIKKAAHEQLPVSHPENPLIPGITNTSFAGPLIHEEGTDGEEVIRSVNAVIVSPGRLDRSPCGTGTSARVALLHARGDLKPGQLFRHESLIGSQFDARIDATTAVGKYDAVIPSIAGRVWITSFNQLVLDPPTLSRKVSSSASRGSCTPDFTSTSPWPPALETWPPHLKGALKFMKVPQTDQVQISIGKARAAEAPCTDQRRRFLHLYCPEGLR